MVQYLQETREIKPTLEAKDMHVLKWWVDSSHGLHPEIRSHTVQMMIM